MDFGEAIVYLKNGGKVTRRGWNGKNMFIWLKPGTLIKSEWCHDLTLKEIVDANGGTMEALPTICMKTADNKILTGWLASQTDMLASDWDVYTDKNEPTWDIAEDERVTDEDFRKFDDDDRFYVAFENTQKKINTLYSNEEQFQAKEVFDDLLKNFKADSAYLEKHKVQRTPEQEFEAEVQNVGSQILRMSTKEESLNYLKHAKDELEQKADTQEKKTILESNFKLFEEYVGNK